MSDKTAVLFDMDGTLLDTLDDLTASVNYCMDKYQEPRHTRDEVREMVGNGIYVLLESALPGGRNHPQYEEIAQDYSVYYRDHMLDHTVPYDGIVQMLHGLRSHQCGIAVVSNKFDTAVKDLNRRFFADTIPVAIGEAEQRGIRRKPAPDMIFAAMKELDAAPEQCFYVGDSEVDILTAANAGIPCISVTWGLKSREFLEEHGADQIADTPEELLEIILNSRN